MIITIFFRLFSKFIPYTHVKKGVSKKNLPQQDKPSILGYGVYFCLWLTTQVMSRVVKKRAKMIEALCATGLL